MNNTKHISSKLQGAVRAVSCITGGRIMCSQPHTPTLHARRFASRPSNSKASGFHAHMSFPGIRISAKPQRFAPAVTPSKVAGRPCLVVNTASLCGYTPQLRGLQALHEEWSPKGLVLIGVPSNDFGEQEPWPEEKVYGHYKEKFGVTFAVTGKAAVVDNPGSPAHPLFRTIAMEYGEAAAPGWNFTKYLFDARGDLVGFFPPSMPPEELRPAVEQAVRTMNNRVNNSGGTTAAPKAKMGAMG